MAIGREDLLRVRSSLQRISDELHLILGVLDHHLEAPPPLVIPSASGGSSDGSISVTGPSPEAQQVPREREESVPLPQAPERELSESGPPSARASTLGPWSWAIGRWLVWIGICSLDIGIVVAMQLFLESIGRKRGGSSIMPKKSVASAIATKASSAAAPGAPIPAPSATPGRASSQRLSVLSQPELLAACLTEHWAKLAIGAGTAVAFRLPHLIFSSEGLICNMLANFTVMLRCMSLVMLLVRDDMTLPKKEKVEKGGAPPPPPPPRR